MAADRVLKVDRAALLRGMSLCSLYREVPSEVGVEVEGLGLAVAMDRAVEAVEIVSALKSHGFTQMDIAAAAGVSDRSVRNWSNETPLRRKHEERLRDLRAIVLLIDDSLTDRGVGQWFRAHQRLLAGRRPLDVLAEGDVEAVRRAAEAFANGSYV